MTAERDHSPEPAGVPSATIGIERALGNADAIRAYVEFADGEHRGLYDPATDGDGYPDEEFDATSAMVVNWHARPNTDPDLDPRLRYRMIAPDETPWRAAAGRSYEFWYREEVINRAVLIGLSPGSVYEFRVAENGTAFRFETVPATLENGSIEIAMASDHQRPSWRGPANAIAELVRELDPDLFIAGGDYVGDDGAITEENAERWATYLDTLYGVDDGYFIREGDYDGEPYENRIIPYVALAGNHEIGDGNHLRWPACVATNRSEPGYPEFVGARWMEQLFHWPYRSEGFHNELNPDHPNTRPHPEADDFGFGGFGKLSFSDYLLVIALDSSTQNFESTPDGRLRDWKGDPITDRWPWYETTHADVRQDEWLRALLEPEEDPHASEVYDHLLPLWHRGLFGTVRPNVSLKNRNILRDWLPVLYRNGARLVLEGHEHNYARTVPIEISREQPAGTYLVTEYYEPNSWELGAELDAEYVDEFFAVRCLKDEETDRIVGWEYDGVYASYAPDGLIALGHGGWAAGRSEIASRGAGNAGWWFVDEANGGETLSGPASYHLNAIKLTEDAIEVASYHPDELSAVEDGADPAPIHRFRFEENAERWYAYDDGDWIEYERLP